MQAKLPLPRCQDLQPPARLAGSLFFSLLLHLALLLSLGHMQPFAAAWQAPSFELTVFLAPESGRAARNDTPPREEIPETARPALQAAIAAQPAASPPADDRPATAAEHDAPSAATPTPERLISLALPPGMHYFASREVDVPAQPINDVLLRYPLAAYKHGLSGIVKLRVFISAGGEVDSVEIIEAEPKDVFEEAATDAAAQLLYAPAMMDGRAVNSVKTIAIVFDPSDQPLR